MKKLLALNFFPAFTPPASGGELRLVNMYRQLSRYFEISLVSWTYPQCREEIVLHGPNFREFRVPKTKDFDQVYKTLSQAGIKGELSGVACAMVGRNHTRYHEIVAELLETSDGVIHEFPYTVPYDPGLGRDGKPRFYNSDNFESEMIDFLITGDRTQEVHDLVLQLETTLARNSQVILAISPAELLKFRFLYGVPPQRLCLTPNGYDPDEFDFTEAEQRPIGCDQQPFILFMGSQHPPSIEAANYIVQELAPQFPQQRFVIAGRVGLSISQGPGNVQLLGEVSTREKRHLFATAAMFINPMFGGAGTCLKTIEALAAGLPLVTTPVGARGLHILNGVHALVVDRSTFPHAVSRLLQDDDLRQRLSEVKHDPLVTTMSWPVIASKAVAAFEAAFEGDHHRGDEAAMSPALVLNDFSAANPLAGGSKRLYSLLRETAKQRPVVLLCQHDKAYVEVEELAQDFVEMAAFP